MKLLAVAGPEPARDAVADALAGALAERGQVATVDIDGPADVARESTGHRAGGSGRHSGPSRPTVTRSTVGPDGLTVTGTGAPPLEEHLDALSRSHDYALVAMPDDATGAYRDESSPTRPSLPTVLVGAATTDSTADTWPAPVVVRVSDPDDPPLSALLAAIEDVEHRSTLQGLVDRVRERDGAVRGGAIATFTGRVRRRDGPDDVPTEHLEYESYEAVLDDQLATIREDLEARDGVLAVELHHRTGVVPAGEDAVHVVVLAGHREAAFRAAADGIDRLKDEAAIFKKEVTAAGEYWHPREPAGDGDDGGE